LTFDVTCLNPSVFFKAIDFFDEDARAYKSLEVMPRWKIRITLKPD